MAISVPSSVTGLFDQAPSARSVTLPSVPFTSGRLSLFAYEIDAASVPDLSAGYTFLHSGTDRTANWSLVTQVTFGTARVMGLYSYVAGTTETANLNYVAPGSGLNSSAYELDEVASGFNAATPVLQSKTSQAVGAASIAVTLDSVPITGNALMAFVGSRAASGLVTPRTNWTELDEVVGAGTTGDSGGLETQYTFTLEQTASATPASGTRTWGIIAIEIAAAAAGGAVIDTWQYRQALQGAFFA